MVSPAGAVDAGTGLDLVWLVAPSSVKCDPEKEYHYNQACPNAGIFFRA